MNFRLAVFATILAGVVVVLGAFTRLVDAGLGCPDWPGCYGHLSWPDSHEEIARAEARFPHAPVEPDKTWPEMVHRYFAGTLGLVIACIGFLSWRFSHADRAATNQSRESNQACCPESGAKHPLKLPLALIGLVIVQALFGMWTVTLKLWPQVVTAHLLGGFATLSLLWLLVLRLSDTARLSSDLSRPASRTANPRLWAWVGLCAVIAQIALGGWTSSNYAALACTDLPACQGRWWPETDFAQGFDLFQHIGPNYLGGLLDNEARTAIHLSHRVGALIVTALILVLVWKLWRLNRPIFRRLAALLLAVLAVQITLGVSNILWALPLAVAVAHNGVGAALLLVLVSVNYYLYCAETIARKAHSIKSTEA